jgi:tRNA threonylcarbamoyladenosine biosynthesis protein TsaB
MLLAVDTSTQMMGLALYASHQVVGEMMWQTHVRHTVELAPAVDHLLGRCGVKATELEALGVALGPGSFTSLRIGLGLVKGMALALHIPVVGIPTLDFLAAAQPPSKLPMAALLKAGRGRLALGWYRFKEGRWNGMGSIEVVTAEDLVNRIHEPSLVCGELTAAERQTLGHKRRTITLVSPAQSMRRPSVLAELAWERFRQNQVDEVVSLAPIYLHIGEVIPD